MAELADAHGSGPCESDFMQVQVLFPAPTKNRVHSDSVFLLHVMEQDLKGVVVNEAPVGLQSHAPTKPQRESSPVSRTIKETSFVYPMQERLSC